MEYIPYHSTKSVQDKKLKSMLSELRSVRLVQAFVDSLVERAGKEEIFIIDMRGGWSREKYEGKKNIVIYEGPKRISAQISAKSPEIEKVIHFLKEKCKIEVEENWKTISDVV